MKVASKMEVNINLNDEISRIHDSRIIKISVSFFDLWRTWSLPVSPYVRIVAWSIFAVFSACASISSIPAWAMGIWFWNIGGILCADLIMTKVLSKSMKNIQELEITADGIIAKFSKGGNLFVNWLKVSKVENLGDLLVVTVATMPKMTLLIPQRSVGTKAELETLSTDINEVWSYWLLNSTKYRLQTDVMKPSGLKVDSNITLPELMSWTFFRSPARFLPLYFLFALLPALQKNYVDLVCQSMLIIAAAVYVLKASQHPDAKQSGTTIISEEGLQSRDGVTGNLWIASWDCVKKVFVWNKMLCIEGDLFRLLLPLRCFEDPVQAQIFVSEAKKFYNKKTLKTLRAVEPPVMLDRPVDNNDRVNS